MTDEKPKLTELAASIRTALSGATNITKPVPPPMSAGERAAADARLANLFTAADAGDLPTSPHVREAASRTKPDSTPERKAEIQAAGVTFNVMAAVKKEERANFAAREALRRAARSSKGKGQGE